MLNSIKSEVVLDAHDPMKHYINFFDNYKGNVYYTELSRTVMIKNKSDFIDELLSFIPKDAEYYMDRYYNIIIYKLNEYIFKITTPKEDENCEYEFFVEFSGDIKICKEYCAIYKDMSLKYAVDKNVSVTWYFISPGRGLDNMKANIKIQKTLNGLFYPYIENIDDMLESYAKAEAPILILTGEPGTGKTTFIRYLINKLKHKTCVTYDEEVMNSDIFYMNFLHSDNTLLVIEDADLLMSSRESAFNKTMSKLLNVSDGLISIENKKIIFTANLKTQASIDEALMRPGRCFESIEFRPLTRKEALVAAESEGIELGGDKSHYTVAEIFNNKENKKKQRVGFGFGGV